MTRNVGSVRKSRNLGENIALTFAWIVYQAIKIVTTRGNAGRQKTLRNSSQAPDQSWKPAETDYATKARLYYGDDQY